jgi:hypothetical protein
MSTTVTKEGIVEALSATVRPDLRPPGMGACTCPPGTLYASCTCAWVDLIDRLLFYAYGRQADPATIAREISDTATWFHRNVAPAARRNALTTLARQWGGTFRDFAKMLGVTAPAIRKAAPAAARMIRERVG